MRYKYCPNCGNKLIDKIIGDEGSLPYCENCSEPFWDTFSSSIICAVVNEYNEIALLNQDYVSTDNLVLVAGMVKIGETIEVTVHREVEEELGLTPISIQYIRSYYYDKKSLLMNGFLVRVNKSDFQLSGEVNNARWFAIEEAPSHLRQGGIAWQLTKEIVEKKLYQCHNGVRSTAKAIICHRDKILLNKCYDANNGHYYSLPGGGQNRYESIYDAIKRECLEETGYQVTNIQFAGICEEICDNEDTRTNYSQYAHKFYHIFKCELASESQQTPTEIDDMQECCNWVDIANLSSIRILPTVLAENIEKILSGCHPMDMGSIHIPYNHG